MKQKILSLILSLFLLASLTASTSSTMTTWAPAEVVCPICKHKNTFMQIMSYGSYIYEWPSKFQYIYWPLTDSPVLYSCAKCHYTAFMWDYNDGAKNKEDAIRKMLESLKFEGTYAKYTDIPMSQRLAIAEKVYQLLDRDDEWWCQFERVKGYHFAAEKKQEEADGARRKALSLAEKMLNQKGAGPSQKELYLITGSMKYFLKDHPAAIKDLEYASSLKFEDKKLGPEKSANMDAYLAKVLKDFIAAIKDEEVAKTEPVWPHRVLKGHDGWVMKLAFSPDNQALASADIDDGLILWNKSTATLTTRFPNRNVIQSVAFSPDGKLFVSGGYNKTIDVWDVPNNKLIKALDSHKDYIHALAFSNDGKFLASGSWDDTVRVWDVTSWTSMLTLAHPESVWDVAFSPDGSTLASIDFKGKIRLWNAKTGKLERDFSVDDGSGFVRFSPGGKLLATGADLAIALVDPQTGKVVRKLEGHERSPTAAAFSPDGQRLASVAWDGTLRIWNVDTGALVEILTKRGGHFRDVAFSPDGQTIATGSDDHTLRLWDVRPGVKAVKPEPQP